MHHAFYVKMTIAIALCLGALTPSAALAADGDAPPSEAALLAALASEADYVTHMEAFRGLRQVGTEAAIPAVAAFLHDEKKSHLARYALESMAYPAAGQALRDAIDGAPASVLPGILNSIGARRDAAALEQLQALMGHGDAQVARNAMASLGRIGTPDAAAALQAAYKTAPDDASKLALAEALLTAAQYLVADGHRKEAAGIYNQLEKPENPEFVREGAFAGLALAAPGKTPERVIAAIQGDDPLYRNLAREAVATTRGKQATARYVEALPTLPEAAQVQLLAGLGRRGDRAARESVVAAVASANPEVKKAALDALGELGNRADVALLAGLMGDDSEDIATAARNSLIRLRGEKIDSAIVAAIEGAGPALRAPLLTILNVRISDEAVPQAKAYLTDEAEPVRVAALNVILQLGQVGEFDAVLAVMKSATADGERDLAARTLSAIARRNSAESLPLILAALADSPEPVKIALVDALGGTGGEAALDAVQAQLAGASPALKRKALSVLSDWPSQEAADTLLELAKSEDPEEHSAGIRGYTRLAQAHPEHDPRNAMMATAMELTRSKEEKWMVLSAYGNVHTGPAMDMLESQLADPEVRREAAMALLKVAEAVSKHGEGGQARARQSLELLKSSVDTEYIVKRCEELLAGLN